MATLLEMSEIICTELGVYDDTSKLLCKMFLSRQYLNLWDKYPWGDATGYGTAQAAAGISVVNYPAGMDRIITVRATTGPSEVPPTVIPDEPDDPTIPNDPLTNPGVTDSWFLDPVDSTYLIESEPRIYEDRGVIKYYEEIGDASGRQIRLYPIPTRGVILFFFGKMQCPGLAADTDVPRIRNIVPTLMAYAYFDMLQRQRQYGKADLKRKEAQELEANAWNLEQQQANQPRRTKATTVAGNSLGEMTDAVCTICGQWTPDYRQVIREFLRRNYQTLYDSFLWPESQVGVRVPYTTGNVVLPEYIDKVITVRGTNNQRLFAGDAALFMDIDPEIFNEFGDPIGYITVTPVGVATLPATTTKLVVASTNPADTGMMMLRGEVLATGRQVEENIRLNGTTPVTSYWVYDIPLTVSKDITLGFVTVNAQSDGANLVQLLPYQRESKHQRLAFLPLPDPSLLSGGQTYHCLVIGKRAIRPLLTDQDTPIITGAQQVLIAGAAADLFLKLEKPDLSTAMSQKATSAHDILKDKNMVQANQPRRIKSTTVAGNTLAEMTDAVCIICGQWTPEYRLTIREFLRRNYTALYDSFLWPESLVGVSVPYTNSNVVVPEIVDKVLSVRGNNNARMFPVEAGLLMDISPEIFSEFGEPINYITGASVAVDTLPSAVTKLVISSTSDLDVSQMMLRGEVFGTGTHVEENIQLTGTTPVTSFWSYDIPLTISKDITKGFINVRAQIDNELLLTLLPYRREAKHQRLIFYPLVDPRLGRTYHCLIAGKRSIRPLLIDEDTPIITGAQDVLIAGAAADLYRKLEKPDMATAFQQKASAAAEILKAKNTDQAAHAPRFVPQIEPRSYLAGGVGGCAW